MEDLVASARAGELTDEDIAELATRLAGSGAMLSRDDTAVDVASTGGISSLSTLLCTLQLRSRGFRVSTLGVVGRPAGGVDVLQNIPGYDAHLTPKAASFALANDGYVHLLADEQWAPLDAHLFAYRQATGAQSLPPLVIGSLLAKKLAAGTVGAGLEIRVAAHGNFGDEFAAARLNAQRYISVARVLGLRPSCALTDASQPYQPYLGRGEALLAPWIAVTHARQPAPRCVSRSVGMSDQRAST
jgi:thymidine phosphorylase